MTGKVGADVTLEGAQEAAKCIAINILATLKGRGVIDESTPHSLRAKQSCRSIDLTRVRHSHHCIHMAAELGDLDKIKRVVKLVGFVNCVDGFTQQPQVVNGASDFLVKILGDKGVHARSAVGTNALPLNVPVEIEAIVEVED